MHHDAPLSLEGRYSTDTATVRHISMTNFTDDITSAFLPNVPNLGLTIVEEQASETFGDALVVLWSGDVRVQIVRDRSQIFADLGAAAEPATWFDAALVMEALGLTTGAVFGGKDPYAVLPSIAAFLKSVWPELLAMFDARHCSEIRRRLSELRESRAARRWG